MTDVFEEPDGATPLAPEEKRGLLPAYITYRSELNEAEQRNIIRAEERAFARRRDLLTEAFIRNLHRRMLGDVRRWAGRFRTSERNLGIPYFEIPMAVRTVLDDARTWLMADLLVIQLGEGRFSWGRIKLQHAGDVRTRYISALKAADQHDIRALLEFARS